MQKFIIFMQFSSLLGCTQINSIDFNHHLDPPRRLLLQYLDVTDCYSIDDDGLKTIVQNCPQLVYLYLRRCTQITGKFLTHTQNLHSIHFNHMISLLLSTICRLWTEIRAKFLYGIARAECFGLCKYHGFRSVRASQIGRNAAIFVGGKMWSSVWRWIESDRTTML